MRRWFRRCLVALVALVVLAGNALIVFCWRHNVWSQDEWLVYKEMDRRGDPAWLEYHHGRVRAGDPVDRVIEATSPAEVVRKGHWTYLRYKRWGAAAYDGRMVCALAVSCCWERIFFDELNDAQCLEFYGRSRAQVDAERREDRRSGGIVVR
jgi:hypothetical protein